ncbi:MAG: flagellar type III secretion system pore protein FliP [Defluviitaleaceae bacterium]|nr:flagellar type III secretion system pore protein FliP [Defluviitaleaceae bacterium]
MKNRFFDSNCAEDMSKKMNRRKLISFVIMTALFMGLFGVADGIVGGNSVNAAGIFSEDPSFLPEINLTIGGTDDPESVVATLQVLFLVSLIALAPSLLVLLTGFTRIVITLSFARQAMATQQMPPNQVLVGIALFMTIFIMSSTFNEINENAIVPFGAGELDTAGAIQAAWEPLQEFMLYQLSGDSGQRAVTLFTDLGEVVVDDARDIPASVLIPAFILNELTMGFIMGFVIYLPFIVVDMVVASVLMSMGMMMLPPAMISLPFKIMVFILSGGWRMIVENMLLSFR